MHDDATRQDLPANQQQQSVDPTPAPDTPNGSVGDEVMGILEDVEKQFERLREAQHARTDELTSLHDRGEALDSRETALKQQQESLQGEQRRLTEQAERLDNHAVELDAQFRLLDEQSKSIESRQADLESELAELTNLQDDLDQQRQAVAAAQEAMQQQRQEFEQQQHGQHAAFQKQQASLQSLEEQLQQRDEALREQESSLNETRQELDAQQRALSERLGSLDERDAQIEQARQAADVRQRELDQAQQELSAERGRVEEQEIDLLQQAEQIGEDRQAVEVLKIDLQSREQALEENRAALEVERTELSQRQETIEAECASLRQQMENAVQKQQELQQGVEDAEEAQLAAEIERDDRIAQVKDLESKLATTGERLKQLAAAIAEQEPELERGAAAMATVDQQKRQIEGLQQELAGARQQLDPEALQRKESRIEELTEALKQARGQTAGEDGDVAELQLAIGTLTSDNERLRLELEQSQIAAEQMASSQSHDDDARSAAHQKRLDEQRDEIERLEANVQALSEQLADAQQQPAAASDDDAYNEKMEALRRNAQKVQSVAAHLQQRRLRLKRVRRLLADRPAQGGGTAAPTATPQRQAINEADMEFRAKQMREMDAKRQELERVRDILSVSETKMIKSWARGKAVTMVAWLVMIGVASGMFSWAMTDHLMPVPVRAAATFEARSINAAKLTEEDRAYWNETHQQMLAGDPFIASVAKRCADRAMEPYGNASVLGERFKEDLVIDAELPGQITLTLRGEGEDATSELMDILCASIVVESNRQASSRMDNARAVPTQERKEDGRIKYCSLQSTPQDADGGWNPLASFMNPVLANHVFVGSAVYLGLFIMVTLVYVRLVRAKRVFDQSNPLFSISATAPVADDGDDD